MNLSKLEDLLEEIEYTVDCHESNAFSRDGFTMCVSLGETLLSKNGIKCYGLAHKLTQDEKAMRLVERISLKRKMGLSPEYQLGLIVASTVYVLHKTNEFKENYESKSAKKALPDLVKNYEDLDFIT